MLTVPAKIDKRRTKQFPRSAAGFVRNPTNLIDDNIRAKGIGHPHRLLCGVDPPVEVIFNVVAAPSSKPNRTDAQVEIIEHFADMPQAGLGQVAWSEFAASVDFDSVGA
jgi:hypothetical protein